MDYINKARTTSISLSKMPIRIVSRHVRDGDVVDGYIQRYKSPRGMKPSKKNLGKPSPRKEDKTYWLKNRAGEFVGRADSEGETTATNYVTAGPDFTRSLIDKKYGRKFGRYKSKTGKELLKRKNR